MRTSLPFVIPLLACTLGLAACSDDSPDGAAGAAGSQPGNDAAAGSAGTAGAAGSAGTAGAAGGAGEDAGTDAAVEIDGSSGASGEDAAVGPVGSCSELSTTDCFSNLDCPAEQRCQNAGTELDPVPCCVPGARGTGAAGTSCTLELDCESAVCIEGLCSKTCTKDEDCPAGMKSCIPIAFSGSDDNWCFPVK